MSYPTLKTPPIKEAIFTISFQSSLDKGHISSFIGTPAIKDNYSIITSPQSDEKEVFITRRLKRKDGNRLITIRESQFSYHSTEQYTTWDVMFDEFSNIYCELIAFDGVTLGQISVRYINRFPLPDGEINKHIEIFPRMPSTFNGHASNFFLQIGFPKPSKQLNGVLTEILQFIDKEIIITLDISVSKDIKLGNLSKDNFISEYTEIRDFKNELFFGSITEKTKERFNS